MYIPPVARDVRHYLEEVQFSQYTNSNPSSQWGTTMVENLGTARQIVRVVFSSDPSTIGRGRT